MVQRGAQIVQRMPTRFDDSSSGVCTTQLKTTIPRISIVNQICFLRVPSFSYPDITSRVTCKIVQLPNKWQPTAQMLSCQNLYGSHPSTHRDQVRLRVQLPCHSQEHLTCNVILLALHNGKNSSFSYDDTLLGTTRNWRFLSLNGKEHNVNEMKEIWDTPLVVHCVCCVIYMYVLTWSDCLFHQKK